MNLSQAVIARSDQLNADDLVSGPRTFTVAGVRRGDAEQPVAIELTEFPGRPFKPSKTVLRILAHAWGEETDDWPQGARFTLYRDEKVKWAGQEIGGIRVSHMSHLDKPIKIALAESKGKKTLHTVLPLPDAPKPPPEPTAEEVAACTDVAALGAMWKRSGPERRQQIEARVSDLKNEPEPDEAVDGELVLEDGQP